jgi:hypothetical protein
VVADRALEERRWTTPELLAVEERLVAAAVERRYHGARAVAPEAVREALAVHSSLGADQAGMVRDACLDGAGVRVVVGRPGTGKTYTMFCSEGFTARGEVVLLGAHIGGSLDLRGATLTNPDGPALIAAGLTVDQEMLPRETPLALR